LLPGKHSTQREGEADVSQTLVAEKLEQFASVAQLNTSCVG
jgi:hypothetical protein